MGKFLVFISGLLFGTGVTISGMVNPMKILNFLDIFGPWDATLLFVMSGGLLVTFLGYRMVMTRPAPFHAATFSLPQTEIVDAKLLGGAAVFGLGWGLSGFCPGPAIAGLVLGRTESMTFVIAMAAGMIITTQIQNRMKTSEAEAN